jgi:hypothetical protein
VTARRLTKGPSAVILVRPFKLHVTESRPMVSSTQQFERIRKRKMTTNGKRNKRERRRLGTPSFPIHVEGYSATAADAPRKSA